MPRKTKASELAQADAALVEKLEAQPKRSHHKKKVADQQIGHWIVRSTHLERSGVQSIHEIKVILGTNDYKRMPVAQIKFYEKEYLDYDKNGDQILDKATGKLKTHTKMFGPYYTNRRQRRMMLSDFKKVSKSA